MEKDLKDLQTEYQKISKNFDLFNARKDFKFSEKITHINQLVKSSENILMEQEERSMDLKDGIRTIYAQLTEAESFMKSMTKLSTSKQRNRKLAPEQADQEKKINSLLDDVRSRLEDVEEYAFHLQTLLDKPEKTQGFSLNTVYRTMKNINCAALEKSAQVFPFNVISN